MKTKTKDQKAKEKFENAWSSGRLAPEHHKFVEKEAVWLYLSKEIAKAREEGWQTGFKQTRSDYVETIKGIAEDLQTLDSSKWEGAKKHNNAVLKLLNIK